MEAAKPDEWPTYTGADAADRKTKRIRVVVVGSGWGACSFIKAMRKDDAQRYDVTLISPRNYFLYTPLLPAVATGTIEERSIVEPVRRIMAGKGNYFEASVEKILPDEQAVVACFPRDVGFPEACFKVPYDMLVVAVGSVNNTFGIKGVTEHTMAFRGIRDATALRRQVSECFERAALPHTPPEERKKLLSFVIVGGGPTGVEVAAELHDMIRDDLRKVYEGLMRDVNIRVIELQDHVLSMYDRQISNYTQKEFQREGINLVFNSRVAAVDKEQVTVINNLTKEEYTIPFGACVWSTGVAMHPLLKQLQQSMSEGTQTHFRSIVTDPYLRAVGSNGTIIAIGDGATVEQLKSLDKASELFDKADTNGDGKLQVKELAAVLREASAEFPQLAEHASFLDERFGGSKRWGGMVGDALRKAANKQASPGSPMTDFTPETEVTKEDFEALLEKIDQGLRALPATAQVAKQQGQYLAKLVSAGIAPGRVPEGIAPFKYNHKGSLAYVGRDRAVMDVPGIGPISGLFAGIAWKGFETYSQFSFRNLCLVSLDWVRTKIFGRDISRV
jgi:NADH:ubiquinone reductase (non-electrogenic)